MTKDHDQAPTAPRPPTSGKLVRIGLKIIKWLAIVVVALMALYLVGVNLVLNTPIGKRLAVSHPEVVIVEYSSAWTFWPGRFHVKGADISGQDSENQFWVTAETAAITFTTKGISTKDVTGTNLRGEGVTLKIRRRVVKLPPDKELAKLPPIKGFPSPLKPDLPDRRVIGVRLEDIKAKHIRDIWVDGFRVLGDIDAEGGMYYKPKVAMRVYPSNIVIKEAKVVTGDDQKVASNLKGTVWVNVEEVDLSSMAQRDLRLVSAATDLSLQLDTLHFINDMLPKGQGLAVEDGAAKLTIAVKIDKGILGESTQVKMEMPNIGVALPLFRVRTAVEFGVSVDAEKQYAVVSAELQSLVLAQRSNGKADVRSKVIRMKGHNSGLDLAKKMTFEARVDIPAVVAGDLTFVNDFVPKDKPVVIEKGAATLSGHFNFSSARHHLDGLIDIEATKLGIKNNSAHIFGLVKMHGLLHELDTESMAADFSGTWFALEDVTVFLDGKEVPNWKLRVDLTKAVAHPEGKRKMDATAKVYIKNLQPAVNVIGTNIKIPWVAKALAYRENVVVNAHIELEKDALFVPRLNVENDSFIVQGRLKITDLQRKPPHQEAAILIKIAGLSIGIELHDKSIKPILINAQSWFDQQSAAAGGPSASAAALQEGLEAGAQLGAMLGNAAGNAAKPVVPKAVGDIAGAKPLQGTDVKPVLVPAVTPKATPATEAAAKATAAAEAAKQAKSAAATGGKPATAPAGKPAAAATGTKPAAAAPEGKPAAAATGAKPAAKAPEAKSAPLAPESKSAPATQ